MGICSPNTTFTRCNLVTRSRLLYHLPPITILASMSQVLRFQLLNKTKHQIIDYSKILSFGSE